METFLDLIRCQLKVSKRISNHSNEVLDLLNSSTISTTPKQNTPLTSQQSASISQLINGRFALAYYYQKHMNTKQFNIACDALIDNIKAYRNFNTLLEQQFDKIMQDLFQTTETQQNLQQQTTTNSMSFLEMNDLRIKFQILELEWFTKQQSQASSGTSEQQHQPIDIMYSHHPSFVESPFAIAEPHLSVSKYRPYLNTSSYSKKHDTQFPASSSSIATTILPNTQTQLTQESESTIQLTGVKRKLNNAEPREQSSIRNVEKQLKSTEESIFKHIISTPALLKLESQFEEPVKSKFELADQTVKKRCIEILNSFVPDSLPANLGLPSQISQLEQSTALFRMSQNTPQDQIAKSSTSPIILEQLQLQQQQQTPQKNQISQLFHSTIATKIIPQSTKSTNLMPIETIQQNQQQPNSKFTKLITPLKEFVQIESQSDIEQFDNPILNIPLNVQLEPDDLQQKIPLLIEAPDTILPSSPQIIELTTIIQQIDPSQNIPLHPVIQEEITPKKTNTDIQQLNVLPTQHESASKDEQRIEMNPCINNEIKNTNIPISVRSAESQVGFANLKIEETKEVTQVVPIILPPIITPPIQVDERKNIDIQPQTQTTIQQPSRKQHTILPQQKLNPLQKSNKKDTDETYNNNNGEEGDEDEDFTVSSESNQQMNEKEFSESSMDDSLNSDSDDADEGDSSESDNSSDSSSDGGRNFNIHRKSQKDSNRMVSSKPSLMKLKPKILLSNSSGGGGSNSNSRSFPQIPSLDSSYDTHLQTHTNINNSNNNTGYQLNVNDLFASPWDETYVKPKFNIKKKRQILDEDSDQDFEDSDDSYDCQEDEQAEKALQKQDRLLCSTPSKKLNKKTVTFSQDLISPTSKPPPKKRGRKPKIRYDENGNPIPRPEESQTSNRSSNNTQTGKSRHMYDVEHTQKRSKGSRRGYKHLTKEEIELIKRSSRKDVAILSKRLRLSYQTLRKIFIRLEEEGEFD